jgi:gliding motility-associated-like protein
MQNIMKNIYYLSLTLLLLFSTVSNAQWQSGVWTGKQANNWFFADQKGLNFDTSPPRVVESEISWTAGTGHPEGFGAISDSEGNLLFYTDGNTVWNKNHGIMLNGEGLLGNGSSTQSGLIVPKPGSADLYYIFTLDDYYEGQNGFRFNEVDMSLDGGLGGITQDKNILLDMTPKEKMSATYHADGKNIWVVVRDQTTFKAYLVTENGVSTTSVDTPGEDITSMIYGQMKFSPEGNKLAYINGLDTPVSFHVLDFDKNTGEFSNDINLNDITNFDITSTAYGLEFSPNGQFIYFSNLVVLDPELYITDVQLHQIDLNAGDAVAIRSSDIILTNNINLLTQSTALQLGADGKIYFGNGNQNTINVINYPNNLGISCGYEYASINWPYDPGILENFFFAGLPNFITNYFKSGILQSNGECIGVRKDFSTIRIPGITAITWDFGDTVSGADNTSTAFTPSHVYNNPGTYIVTATITSNGAQQTATTQVIITIPDAVVPQVPALCADANGNAIFNLEALSSGILNGQDATMFTVTYFASEADLQAGIPIATPANFTTTGQTIYAQVTNTGTGCTTKIQFNLPVNPLPQAATPATLSKCGTPAGTAAFNLKNQDAAILNGQDAANFTVNYFLDANAQNAIITPESFTSSGQTVYAVVSNNSTGCTSGIVSFNVAVTEVSLFTQALQLTGCSPFNLNLISNQLEERLIFTFYTTQQDAENESDAIANQEQYTTPAKEAVVYVRAQNTDGCVDITDVVLQQGDCSIPKGISPNGDEKNDSFDLSGFDVSYLGIYNRYGQEVYSKDNYTSEWHGQSGNNSELPTGTYYYMVKRNDGRSETGWVYVNREEK